MTEATRLLELALLAILDADPGPRSEQSLAHEMAAIAKQALNENRARAAQGDL